MAKTKILILGAGFGGIKAALGLCGDPNFEVTLLNDRDDFRFYPALFETASGHSGNASTIALAEIFEGKDIKLVKAVAQKVDRDNKCVVTQDGSKHSYDTLIIALGVVTNFFGIKGLDKYAYGIKTQEDAIKLRQHIHDQLAKDQKPDSSYVIVGGGPTGIELAGVMPEFINHIMHRHGLPKATLHIDLVEAAPRLLPRMPESFSKKVEKRLKKVGVNLYLNQTVSAETADELQVSGHSIKSHSVIWTAGVTNHPFFKDNAFKLNDHGRVVVNEYLEAEANIYVIGDNADTQYSGMAQTALYDGKFVAANLKRSARGKGQRAYKAKEPAYVIPAGSHWAALQWRGLRFYGRVGWLLRSAADWVAYHDYEPFWKASRHWRAERAPDTGCETCDS